MTRRERLRRLFFHKELDRPVIHARGALYKRDASYDPLVAYVEQHADLVRNWSMNFLVQGPLVETRREPYSHDFERVVSILHTPKGDLQATHLHSLTGQPGLQETHFLKDRDDAEKYLSLPMPEIGGDVSSYFESDRELGDRGIVIADIPGLNPGGFVAELFGSETFAMASLTDRDICHTLMARQMKVIMETVKYAATRGVKPFFGMLGEELILPPLHSPKDFSDFNLRYDQPIIDVIHEAGGRIHIHSHGSIAKVLPDFMAMGTDVLHPFEAPPMGNITPAAAKDIIRGRMAFEGNLQIADMYESTPDDIRAQVETLIGHCFDDRRGLSICPTASPYIHQAGAQCFPQYKAMIDAVSPSLASSRPG